MGWTFYNASGEALTSFGPVALTDLDIDGGTDVGEAIVDADLFIIDNGAGGTNVKTAASRIVTYVGADTDTRSGVAKAWCRITDAGLLESPDYGVASITDTGTGNRTIVWTTAFSSTVYVITSSNSLSNSGANIIINDTFATGSVRHRIYIGSSLIDASTGVAAYGDQ